MTTAPVPPGMQLTADSTLRGEDDGRLVVGGSPTRIVRLTEEGARRLRRWLAGAPVDRAIGDRRLARRLLEAGLVHPRPEGEDGSEVTVVVPVRDDVTGLARVLEAIGSKHRAVVVDDGSSDGAAHRRVTDAAGAHYLREEVASGPAGARNRGLDAVETDMVGFVDSDVTLDGSELRMLAGHFADPAVAAVAPRVCSEVCSATRLERYEAVHSPLDLGPDPSPVGPGRRVSYVPAACLVARTEVVRAVGGFDPTLRFGEDIDLVWRLVGAGHVVRYEPGVTVGHRPRPTVAQWLGQRRRYGSSAAPLAARHGSAVAPARCSPWSAASWGAVGAGHPLVGSGLAAGSTAALAARLAHLPGGPRLAVRLGMLGHLHAGFGLARAAVREWWPLTVGVAACLRRRRSMLALLLLPSLLRWVQAHRTPELAPAVALGIADDLAYGVGVWEGMARERSWAAIRPDFVTWPDRGDLDRGR